MTPAGVWIARLVHESDLAAGMLEDVGGDQTRKSSADDDAVVLMCLDAFALRHMEQSFYKGIQGFKGFLS
jgi:hypothetical protein